MPAHRFLVKFTTQESAKIAQSLKTLGFTFSELLDAACVVATFEHNPVPVDKAETTYIKGPSPCVTYPSFPPPSFVNLTVASYGSARELTHRAPL